MKAYLRKLNNIIIAVFLWSAFAIPTNAQVGITFNFANPQVTTSGPDTFFEFDVMAVASTNTHFKLAQVYIDYNTVAFGPNIVGNAKVIVTKGGLLNTISGVGGDEGSYSPGKNDNTSSKFSIFNTYFFNDNSGGSTTFQVSNLLGTTPQIWVHVKIKVQNTSQSSGLSFDNILIGFDQQQFYFANDVSSPGSVEGTKYSPVSVGSGLDAPLPVELSSFTASVIKGNINLKWQTKTEIDNYGFEVERKVGKMDLESDSWVKMGFVPGQGNSNSPKDYTFSDKNPAGGSKFVYRLKQIDNDGKYSYSDEVEVELVPNEYALYQNYPNPFNPVTNIKFALPKTSKINLTVYNLLGENVATLLNEEKDAGFYNVQFDASRYASGLYIFRLTAGDFVQIKKMNFIK